jgi:hypothetical protein
MENQITYRMPQSAADYMAAVLEAAGNSSEVRQLIEAAHCVLAGGSVNVKVTQSGDPKKLEELNALMMDARRLSNEANQNAGAYVTVLP